MIDFVEIELDGAFPALGKSVRVKQPSGHTTRGFTRDRYYLYGNGADFVARLSPAQDRLVLAFCPPKVLQGHNGIGSNDLRGVVRHAVRVILESLGIRVDRVLNEQLRAGDYRLNKVDINELHEMPHAAIAALVQAIRRRAPDEVQATPLERGIGVRLWPNSDSRQVLIYDKVTELLDRHARHDEVLYAGVDPGTFSYYGLSMDASALLEHLRQGVRIEVRLRRSYLVRAQRLALSDGTVVDSRLDRGEYWSHDTASVVRREILRSVPMSDEPLLSQVELAIAESRATDRTLLVFWHAGRDARALGVVPEATYYRRRRVLLDRYGLDISRPWIDTSIGVSWSGLIDDTSVIPPPRWARSGTFYFSTSRARGLERNGPPAGTVKTSPTTRV